VGHCLRKFSDRSSHSCVGSAAKDHLRGTDGAVKVACAQVSDVLGHHASAPLVSDGVIDASTPETVIYEPQPNGVGADYLVLADQWNVTQGQEVGR
jgi:hypothetical protein